MGIKRGKQADQQLVEPKSSISVHDEILQLESRIQESSQNLNDIVTLLNYFKDQEVEGNDNTLAAVALCRVFCRLMVARNMSKAREMTEKEVIIVQWLLERYQEYQNKLVALLKSSDLNKSTTALTLLMRLVKDENLHLFKSDSAAWRDGTFPTVLRALLDDLSIEDTRTNFINKYLKKYADIRYYTFVQLL